MMIQDPRHIIPWVGDGPVIVSLSVRLNSAQTDLFWSLIFVCYGDDGVEPPTNGICERFHKAMLNEFYRVAFRKKIYRTLEEWQADLNAWMEDYNQKRPYQSRWCYDKIPMRMDSVPLAKEKIVAD